MSSNRLRITSWNVNSIHTLMDFTPWNATCKIDSVLETLATDILCVQETKTDRNRLTRALAMPEGFDSYWSFCNTGQRTGGYSGVATFARRGTVVSASEGLTGCIAAPGAQTAKKGASGTTIPRHPKVAEEFTPAQMRELDLEGRCIITGATP
jgi:AP endonuclease-2